MNIAKIKETCIYIRDLDLAKRFYHEKLGLPIIGYVEGKHIFFRAGNSVLLCFNPDDSKDKSSPPGHFAFGKYHFAFEVAREEYDRTKIELLAKDVVIIDTLKWKNGLESFYFNDPAGNVLEIVPEGIWN